MNKINIVGILVWIVVIACAGAQRPQIVIVGESEFEQVAEKGRAVVYFCADYRLFCQRQGGQSVKRRAISEEIH